MTPFNREEIELYFKNILQLLWPSYIAPSPDTYDGLLPTELHGWSEDQLALMLEEGRQQLVQWTDRFEQIQSRAQWLFTTILTLLVLVISRLDSFSSRHCMFSVAWLIGALLLMLALLGSAAVFLAPAQLGSVDAVKLTMENPEHNLVAVLARSYPKAVVTSANTCRARFTILRDACWLLVLGVGVEAITLVLLEAASRT